MGSPLPRLGQLFTQHGHWLGLALTVGVVAALAVGHGVSQALALAGPDHVERDKDAGLAVIGLIRPAGLEPASPHHGPELVGQLAGDLGSLAVGEPPPTIVRRLGHATPPSGVAGSIGGAMAARIGSMAGGQGACGPARGILALFRGPGTAGAAIPSWRAKLE